MSMVREVIIRQLWWFSNGNFSVWGLQTLAVIINASERLMQTNTIDDGLHLTGAFTIFFGL